MRLDGHAAIHDVALTSVRDLCEGKVIEVVEAKNGFSADMDLVLIESRDFLSERQVKDYDTIILHILSFKELRKVLSLCPRKKNVVILQHNSLSLSFVVRALLGAVGVAPFVRGKWVSRGRLLTLVRSAGFQVRSVVGSGFIAPEVVDVFPRFIRRSLVRLLYWLDAMCGKSILLVFARNLVVSCERVHG